MFTTEAAALRGARDKQYRPSASREGGDNK